jgi:hypothetical protein
MGSNSILPVGRGSLEAVFRTERYLSPGNNHPRRQDCQQMYTPDVPLGMVISQAEDISIVERQKSYESA